MPEQVDEAHTDEHHGEQSGDMEVVLTSEQLGANVDDAAATIVEIRQRLADEGMAEVDVSANGNCLVIKIQTNQKILALVLIHQTIARTGGGEGNVCNI